MCLDNAIAEAVTEYGRLREHSMVEGETERSGVFAHELRNRVSTAQLAFDAIVSGRAPTGGSVAAIVKRSLQRMSALIDRSLVEVRLDSGMTRRQRVHLHELLEEAEVVATMEAVVHGVSLGVTPVDHTLDVNVNPQILAAQWPTSFRTRSSSVARGGRSPFAPPWSGSGSRSHRGRVRRAPPRQGGGAFRGIPAAWRGPKWSGSRSLHQPEGDRGVRRSDSRERRTGARMHLHDRLAAHAAH